MTFGKMLSDHRAHFQRTHKSPPPEFRRALGLGRATRDYPANSVGQGFGEMSHNGHDYGELLYSLGVMGWFMLVTIPGGLVAFASWLIFLILHRVAWRKRVSAGIPPPIPPPPATA
jgi:hypothetical protein